MGRENWQGSATERRNIRGGLRRVFTRPPKRKPLRAKPPAPFSSGVARRFAGVLPTELSGSGDYSSVWSRFLDRITGFLRSFLAGSGTFFVPQRAEFPRDSRDEPKTPGREHDREDSSHPIVRFRLDHMDFRVVGTRFDASPALLKAFSLTRAAAIAREPAARPATKNNAHLSP
jgi:hypothetical protein